MYLDKLISLLYIDLLAVFGAALRQSPPLIYLKTSSTTTKNMQSANLYRQGKKRRRDNLKKCEITSAINHFFTTMTQWEVINTHKRKLFF